MDADPKYTEQTTLWAESLVRLAGVSPDRLLVHAMPACDPGQLKRLEARGIRVIHSKPFESSQAYSNKLVQLCTPELLEAEYVALCDCDLVFLASIEDQFEAGAVRAKQADRAEPTSEVWTAAFEKAGRPLPAFDGMTFWTLQATLWNHCDGGLYLFSRDMFAKMAPLWQKWEEWLANNSEVLGEQQTYSDLVAFVLAADEAGIRVSHLPVDLDMPTHHHTPAERPITGPPRVLHYHGMTDSSGHLRPTGVEIIDKAVEQANDLIRATRRESFDNRSFWDFRYAHYQETGSGVGSRGAIGEYKAHILSEQIEPLGDTSVLEVGCGDLEVSGHLKVSSYLGVDISSKAIETASEKRPDWTFVVGDPTELQIEPREIVVCLDVLIHQPTLEKHEALCKRLVELATKAVIVGAYNQEPWHTSEITFYYEPLSTTLRRLGGPNATLDIVGGYRDLTLIVLRKA